MYIVHISFVSLETTFYLRVILQGFVDPIMQHLCRSQSQFQAKAIVRGIVPMGNFNGKILILELTTKIAREEAQKTPGRIQTEIHRTEFIQSHGYHAAQKDLALTVMLSKKQKDKHFIQVRNTIKLDKIQVRCQKHLGMLIVF